MTESLGTITLALNPYENAGLSKALYAYVTEEGLVEFDARTRRYSGEILSLVKISCTPDRARITAKWLLSLANEAERLQREKSRIES